MLVLTRKLTECIRIGDSVVITVLKLQGNKVRIGIEAPRDVQITRAELRDRTTERPDGFIPDAA
ncbi:MAG: carbon storage regulator [Planctomycetaceae bacterium]